MNARSGTTPATVVLIADDDPLVGLLASETLNKAGYVTTVISDGAAVLDAFDHRIPDVILLDVEMPGASGFDLCREIRRRPGGADVPIVIVTGRDDTESIARAYAAGASDFLLKPLHWPVLPHRVSFMIRAYQAMQGLRHSEQRIAALLQAFPDWIFILDAQGKVLQHLSGAASAPGLEFVGKHLEDCLPPDVARKAREAMQAASGTGIPQSYDFSTGSGDTEQVYETRLQLQPDGTYLSVVREITERRRSEARIQYLAYYDALTGLPNRQLFVRELRRAIRATERKGHQVAVLFIDLDRFKRINDTLGHAVGDALLQSVARRVESSVRPADVVARPGAGANDDMPVRIARLGGDEFVILLTELKDRAQAALVATRVRHALTEPFSSDGHQFVVTPSIGISIFPDDGNEIEELLVKADMAMYAAKDQGRNRHTFYSSAMSIRSLDRLDLENDMRRAIEKSEFMLHYQPKVDARTGAIDSVEALLRWHHPERGWISPATFVPIAEETGLMLPLGDWVIREACRQIRTWASQGIDRICVAVNVSAQQFSRDTFVDSVLLTVREFGICPTSLELELTE
ncbi:MAG: diguanylate cyclase, partial [Gammaproteobacteria bacterium]|nr:diguanylate cyclase [Gammaproteobacteria bacterium]